MAAPKDFWDDLRETARLHADRARRPTWEAWLLEPGLHALAAYRLAHLMHRRGWRFLPRWLTMVARRWTGIELHAGARIGRRCLLLQGLGAVVGETAVLGDDCTLEAGAMLLGSGLAADLPPAAAYAEPSTGPATVRLHPTLGDRVLVEAGSLLIGDIFVGNDVRVSAGAVVTRDVPDGGLALGVPGRVLARAQARPDPDARAIQAMAERIYHLEEQLQILLFATQRQQGVGPQDRWKTRQPDQYGPIQAVEDLIDGAGI